MFFESCQRIAHLLIERDMSVSVAESSTGGLISANLLAVAGASRYFLGGSVVYTLASRRAFLSLDRDKLKALEPLTEPMAAAFADAARLQLNATWGIAELGAAGPAGTPYGHDPGTSVIGISGPIKRAIKFETGSDNRQKNMLRFTEAALKLFEETLLAT